MYNYWKTGGDGPYKRNEEFLTKFNNYTIKDFINLLKSNSEDLHIGYTSKLHYLDYTHWINKVPLNKIIVIIYKSDIQKSVEQLFNSIKIPINGEKIPIINVSVKNKIDLDQVDIEYIKSRFCYDDELLETAKNNPEKFKLVID
jgi:hypothetical protein